MKVFLCGFGYPGQYALVDLHRTGAEIAVFTHDGLPNAPGLSKTANDLKVKWTLENVNNIYSWPFQPDVIVSVYYRYIIKSEAIRAVNGCIFNVHPSLLPKHRGCSSIPWAIIDGDSHAGVTFHYINEGVDTGPVIMQAACQIESQETALTLTWKVNKLAIDFFPMAFALVKAGYDGVQQSGTSSYHRRGAPYDGVIDLKWPVAKIERFIRAMTYPPYPYATINGQEVKSMVEYKEAIRERVYS